MEHAVLDVTWAGEALTLLDDRALWWGARRSLIIADLHLGKPAAFRAAGVPVPESITTHDLGRLGRLIEALGAARLVVLGDLLHASTGMSPEVLDCVGGWRRAYRHVEMLLVRGNHDIRAGGPPADWDLRVAHAAAIEPPFAFVHEPREHDGLYTLAGHLHPCVRLNGPGVGALRPPCFWFTERVAVLPAFGSFTGCAVVRPRATDRVYAVGPGCVHKVSGPVSTQA